jgi:hypothetical protein
MEPSIAYTHTHFLPRPALWLDLVAECADMYRRPARCRRALLAAIPCVADADGEPAAVCVERDGRHGGGVLGVLPQALLKLEVPDRHGAVRAGRGEGVVAKTNAASAVEYANDKEDAHGVEGKRIHGPDVVDIVNRLPVALECVLFVLHLGRSVKVLDRNAPLDRRCRVPCIHIY